MIEVLPEECPNLGHLRGSANFEPWGVAVARGHLSIPLSQSRGSPLQILRPYLQQCGAKRPQEFIFSGTRKRTLGWAVLSGGFAGEWRGGEKRKMAGGMKYRPISAGWDAHCTQRLGDECKSRSFRFIAITLSFISVSLPRPSVHFRVQGRKRSVLRRKRETVIMLRT